MTRFVVFLFSALLVSAASAFGADWTGTWDTHLRGGSARLILKQDGDTVTGQYPLYDGRIEAKSDGRRLEGRWFEGSQSGPFMLILGADGRSFAGRYNNFQWWSGERANTAGFSRTVDLSTPRTSLVNFIVSSNVARGGLDEAWGTAASSVEFPDTMTRGEQLELVRHLFALIDLTTFRIWTIPEHPSGSSVELQLIQPRSDAALTLTMKRDSQGNWRIVPPSAADMAAARKALLASYGGVPPVADAFKRLQNPRDTMRAFLEGMADWSGEGRALAMSTLDMSEIPDLLHDSQGALLAQYLRRTLDHIGLVGLQSIPNDGQGREPYVHFIHPQGRIVIAPSGTGADTKWLFTAKTLADIRGLHSVVERLPPPLASPPGLIPHDPFFTMHSLISSRAPLLVERVGQWEYWQMVALLLALTTALLLATGVAWLICRLVSRIPGASRKQPRIFFWALALPLLWVFMQRLVVMLGVPGTSREYALPVAGSLASICAGIAAWHILRVIGDSLAERALRTSKTSDDILVTFVFAAARLGVVLLAALGVAHFLSIPMTSILAGLGIGGLAIAFASRETLSNVFGAGILVSDRPFQRGDWIKSGDIEGYVEEVGIRSTRLRTTQDSVVVVPNGRLADSTINNQGSRTVPSFKTQLVVTEGGAPDKVLGFIEALRQRVTGDKAFDASRTNIWVSGVTPSGIEIDLSSYWTVRTKAEENAARHALLIDVVRLADKAGLSLGPGMKGNAPAPA